MWAAPSIYHPLSHLTCFCWKIQLFFETFLGEWSNETPPNSLSTFFFSKGYGMVYKDAPLWKRPTRSCKPSFVLGTFRLIWKDCEGFGHFPQVLTVKFSLEYQASPKLHSQTNLSDSWEEVVFRWNGFLQNKAFKKVRGTTNVGAKNM